jgi:hypothetical protein
VHGLQGSDWTTPGLHPGWNLQQVYRGLQTVSSGKIVSSLKMFYFSCFVFNSFFCFSLFSGSLFLSIFSSFVSRGSLYLVSFSFNLSIFLFFYLLPVSVPLSSLSLFYNKTVDNTYSTGTRLWLDTPGLYPGVTFNKFIKNCFQFNKLFQFLFLF